MIITAIGDCGVDQYQKMIHPGGCALNFATHSKALWEKSAHINVLGALGCDQHSAIILKVFDDFQISDHTTKLSGTNSVQKIGLKSDGEKVFLHFEPGVLVHHRASSEQLLLIKESDLVMNVLFPEIEDFFVSTLSATPRGIRAVDFMTLNDYDSTPQIVRKYIDSFDVGFFGLKSEQTGLIKALQELSERYDKLFIVTLGPKGSLTFRGAQSIHTPASSVKKIVDTTGAGDSFAAAFFYSWFMRNLSTSLITEAQKDDLIFAHNYACKTIQHFGATASLDKF